MSDAVNESVERSEEQATPTEELNREGVGGTQADEPTTFEPEEPGEGGDGEPTNP